MDGYHKRRAGGLLPREPAYSSLTYQKR